jgi:hypothetical protein
LGMSRVWDGCKRKTMLADARLGDGKPCSNPPTMSLRS